MAEANFDVEPYQATDAAFRAWTLALHNAIVAVGLVAVAQTGEMDFTTVLAPSASNQKRGFRMYRFADALQATHPVFIRIDYGSGASAATHPCIWTRVGQTADGAGNLGMLMSGSVLAEQRLNSAFVGENAIYRSYVSGSSSRLTFCLWPFKHAAAELPITVNIERTKDSAGADTAEAVGIVVASMDSGGTKPANVMLSDGRTYSINNTSSRLIIPYDDNATSGASGLLLGVFPVLHFSLGRTYNAMTGILIYHVLDYAGSGLEQVEIYGSDKTYLMTGKGTTLVDATSNHKLAIRND